MSGQRRRYRGDALVGKTNVWAQAPCSQQCALVLEGRPMELAQKLAYAGFFVLPNTFIDEVCEHYHIPKPEAPSEFQIA